MKQKLHILFINSWYPSRIMPTNGDFIQRHAEAVVTDHKVTALHIVSDKTCTSIIDITDEVIEGVRTLIAYVKYTKNPFLKFVRFSSAFRKILRKADDFNVVHVNRIYPLGAYALYLKYFKRKPFIISEHWTDYTYPLSQKIGSIERYVSKLITKNASFVCPVTHDLEKSMQSFGLKGTYKRIPNVVDTHLFTPISTVNNYFTIIHISNMIDNYKNITGILRVFAKVNKKCTDIKIKLIGNDATKYHDTIRQFEISSEKIETLNHIPQEELAKHIQSSDLLVLFSNYENLPCVILEAFSCGIPVISTDVGGIKEYFPEGFGSLILAKDENQLAGEIVKFYTKECAKADKNEMHQYVVKNFSKKQICNDFTKLYYMSLTN